MKFDELQVPIDGNTYSPAELLAAFQEHAAGREAPLAIWIGDVTANGSVFKVMVFGSEESSTLKVVETNTSARPDDIEAGKAWVEAGK